MQESEQSGDWRLWMGKTSLKRTQEDTQGQMFCPEVRPVRERLKRQPGTDRELSQPCGLRCCGSSKRCVPAGYSWSSHLVDAVSSLRPRKSFNSLVTGAPGELLTANTGCLSGVSVGFLSEDWAGLGWPYGITFTLTASETTGSSEGHLKRKDGRLYNHKARCSMGTVPTVCSMEFLQGFRRGELHVWALEMRSRSQSPSGSDAE